MKKKIFSTTMSFTLAELKAELSIKEAGVSIGMPTTDTDEYNQMAVDNFNISLKDIPLPTSDGMIIPEGLEINKEDFLYVPFRLLSATMVAAGSWRATFFKPSVLRKAVDMLKGKGVFTNHNDNPKNWAGYVAKTKWQNKTKQGGEVIPAGINGLLGIDTTLERNRDVAKGIVAGSVYSNSVGIMFNFSPSHEYEDMWEFRRNIGTMHEDGTMVHLAVTEILEIYETSLVSLGADPYAKRIGDEGLVNIDKGGTYTESATNMFKYEFNKAHSENKFSITCGLNQKVLLLTGKKVNLDQKKQKSVHKKDHIDMKKEVLAALLLMFGVATKEDLTEDMVKSFKGLNATDSSNFNSVKQTALTLVSRGDDSITDVNLGKFMEKHTFVAKDELTALQESTTKVEELNTKVTELEAEKETLAKDATVGQNFHQMQVELAIKYYRLEKMDKADKAVEELFKSATSEQLAALIKEHGLVIGGKFSYSCSDCGSSDFKFGSAVENAGDDSSTEQLETLKVTNPSTYREKLRNKTK